MASSNANAKSGHPERVPDPETIRVSLLAISMDR